MPWKHLAELCLDNERVQLRALQPADIPQLALVAYDEAVWRYFVSAIDSAADLEQYVHTAVDDTRAGRRAVFAVIDRASGRIAGSMAYGNLAPADLRLEIGWSWLGRAYQRTGLNRAAKLLLLDHAFDILRCERVEFKTDVLNAVARKALEGIGAQAEGVLRSFNEMPGGRRRDALYFSILRAEWPAARARHFSARETLGV